ncbi:MAG TPA: hypothetical protein VK737_07145 [Opitutales bacterium]|jgi:hypothetical protein|nr:hypothetical protein [Opitutales bacterium]
MSRQLFKSPTNIVDWLDTATCRLVPSAQARVRAEIEAHYAAAVQTHLIAGSTEIAAHAAALADLGDVKTAARRFQGGHLTKQDAVQINWCLRYAFVLVVAALGMLLPVITLCLPSQPSLPNYDASGIQAAIMLSLLLMTITAGIAVQVLVWRKITAATMRQSLLLYAVFTLSLGGLFVMIGDGHGITPALTFNDNLVMIVYFAYIGFHFLHLRQKLKSVNENDLRAT